MIRIYQHRNRLFKAAFLSCSLLCGALINSLLINNALAAAPPTATATATTTPTQTQDPYQLVQQTTEQVLALIKEAKSYYQKEPDRFHNQVTTTLDKVIDFENFSRGVMGSYASTQRYKTLASDADKKAFNARIERFSATFKRGLVETYANGLLEFNGEKIMTLPPRKGDDATTGTISVIQHIQNNSSKPYIIEYSMRRNKAGEWKLHNLIIEGINLGLTYRSQFSASADLYKGDVDKVIDNWKVEPQTTNASDTTLKKDSVKTKAVKNGTKN